MYISLSTGKLYDVEIYGKLFNKEELVDDLLAIPLDDRLNMVHYHVSLQEVDYVKSGYGWSIFNAYNRKKELLIAIPRSITEKEEFITMATLKKLEG